MFDLTPILIVVAAIAVITGFFFAKNGEVTYASGITTSLMCLGCGVFVMLKGTLF